MYREKQREVADDLESFMHVINWIALSYHETNLTKSPERLQNFVRSMYLEHNTILDSSTLEEPKRGMRFFTVSLDLVSSNARVFHM